VNLKSLQYYDELFICAYCAYCVDNQASCPTYLSVFHEIVTGRGKMITARNLAQGLISSEEGLDALRDGLFQCTFCGACEEACLVNIPLTKVYSELKTLVQDRLPRNTKKMFTNLEEKHNFYGLDQEDRGDWSFEIEDIYNEWLNIKHDIGYFLGCVFSYSGRAGKGPVAVLRLAKLAGEKISIFSPTAEHNVSEIERLGIKKLIISCAGCYRVFAQEYPRLLGKKLPFKVISHMEYLLNLIQANKLKFNNSSHVKVTYKDPCELGRHCGVYDVARDLLASLPGVENREMRNSRENALCCGAGGLIKANYPVIASDVSTNLILQMEEQNVELCLNACPSCLLNIDENLRLRAVKIKSIDIAELVLDRTKT